MSRKENMAGEYKTRGIRGANCVEANTTESILGATRMLLEEMLKTNQTEMEDIASIHFTLTPDLDAAFPAEAARQLGLKLAPLLCMQEIDVPASLPKVVRILMLVNTIRSLEEINHVFIGEAKALRDDL
jgi:chorismate mutase